MDWEYIEDENDDGSKACVSCKHRCLKKRVVNGEEYTNDFCDIDGHFISYVDCWTRTCKYHRLREKG